MHALLLALLPIVLAQEPDGRLAYDVETYRLDLEVVPSHRILHGTVALDALVTADEVTVAIVDLKGPCSVYDVRELDHPLDATSPLTGPEIQFVHDKPFLRIQPPHTWKKGDHMRLAIHYEGTPRSIDDFTGFHWKQTADKQPWISTSCQTEGSAYWWPCKDSYYHPEDKPERVFENYTVPQGLYAVGNGRLVARSTNEKEKTETFHWVHEYPLETYSVTLDVAPYVVVEKHLELEGLSEPLEFVYYVLPENAEKAALQFQDVPAMLSAFSAAFGPFPFPKSKYALVETSFWGMEHSTAVAYGSSYPAWRKARGEKDPFGSRNARFDYILVHESAHEWWGNAVSARTWGDFWLHEGFATYAEVVYLEHTAGRAQALEHLRSIRPMVGRKFNLYRGADSDSGAAYAEGIYYKGAWVLETLRTFIDDDERFFAALRAFNLEFRYRNATTEDFRAVVERETGREWKRFFDEWIYAAGLPKLEGTVRMDGQDLVADVTVSSTTESTFHLPLDVETTDAEGRASKHRLELEPGRNELRIHVGAARAPRLASLDRILCEHHLSVKGP